MKANLLAACILSFALANAENAQGAASLKMNAAHCTPAYLKQAARDARTREQYSALADCYKQIQKDNLDQAAAEKQEWERRNQSIMVIAAKYPRPVDSARNLYEYYLSKASEAEKMSEKYSQLAAR
jgi:hypothetical protein